MAKSNKGKGNKASKGNETKAEASKGIKAAASNAIGLFPTKTVHDAFVNMAGAMGVQKQASESKASAALTFVAAIAEYRDKAMAKVNGDKPLVLKDYRDNIAVMAKRLADEENSLVTMKKGRGKDAPKVARFSGYGQNVVSIAKGIIELDLELQEGDTYTKIRARVETARRENAPKDERVIRDAVDEVRETFKDAVTIARASQDPARLQLIHNALSEILARWKEQDAEADEVTAETDEEEQREAA